MSNNKNKQNHQIPSTGKGGFFIKSKGPYKHQKNDVNSQKEYKKYSSSLNKFLPHNKEDNCQKEKKPFDKKKWRLKKYSNKYKLEKWEDSRKKKVLHQYYKEVQDEPEGFDVQKIYAELDDSDNEVISDTKEQDGEFSVECEKKVKSKNVTAEKIIEETRNETSRKKKPIKKAYEEFLRLKQEKTLKKEEALKRKSEKEEAKKLSQQKKTERYKKLNRKTRKGQPIMKDRIEMLLEKIQKSCQQ